MRSNGPARQSVLVLSDLPHRQLAEYAARVENLGFDGIWYADERFYHEPYIGLAVIAGATSQIFLGPGVTDPRSRHPALTAAAINSLNELSGGRAILGVGAGKSGFHNLGLTRRKSAVAIREAVAVIDGLLNGQRVSQEGEVVFIDDGEMKVPAAPVPICVAANGPTHIGSRGCRSRQGDDPALSIA